ncbi:cytochrome c biogenesis protein ResB [Massilia antarctica]|uniref:cytochrome c biogenesis protein ResB n=1 Tax=Massilia antarctica TaxID=2765360 RepID=UPI0006BB6A16|nr:cytochrome c biogenesis protein ResB [Massilia sp. H27-R4]MCY0911710.1 cytochrome c biogenesis protein ResB [Massilia sp. H27-R4]CUI06840.1 Cytochrome c-type biogenesis protein Ccs1/ResB [Janthinobacterium sp. CG23_2]CUU30626.1 Cytochrome c-type biogenesis protein Ccs1/ResB [Janthinobacterium sp. CG23_2]
MSTTGIVLNTRRPVLAEAVELVSSMRFAISMLTIIAIASMIGTVLTQNQPMPNYVNQFGPFWFDVFNKLGLYAVYSAWWFLLILVFLIISTSLCIVRNAPKMIKDMRSWRENVRETSLRNFHHKSEWSAPLARADLARQSAARLADAGYAAKIVEKDHATLVAARKGAANKFGYIFAHSSIIIILVGGMLDSDIPIQFQEWFLGKKPFVGGGLISQIPAENRLSLSNPTYRGNTLIPEGQSSDIAIIPRPDGALLQPLPFTIELKRFIIDFYSTGMPKLFASEVVIRDHETGKTFPATIKVNEPLIYKGVAVYQSSFEDGGTKLKMLAWPMSGTDTASFAMNGEVNASTPLARGGEQYTVEWSGFRPFNVENTAGNQDARAVTRGQSLNEQFAVTLDKHSGSAGKNANNKDLKNVGPSVQYKLRDKTGQAREYQNYMQPVTVDGAEVFLAGVRASPGDPFSYLRIPSDQAHTVKEWMRLRAALADPALRELAAERYARRAMPAASNTPAATLARQLQESSSKSLAIFAGDGKPGGYVAVSRFLEKIPAAEQEKAADIFMKILNGTLWELWQAAREKDGLARMEGDENQARFLQLATNALSDSFFYGAPVYLQLDEFVEVKASVLQVTRSPGKAVVYLGCVFLVLGVFAMFYIRERRLWIWVRGGEDGGPAHALMAMSTQRKTLDFEHEFNDLKAKLAQLA